MIIYGEKQKKIVRALVSWRLLICISIAGFFYFMTWHDISRLSPKHSIFFRYLHYFMPLAIPVLIYLIGEILERKWEKDRERDEKLNNASQRESDLRESEKRYRRLSESSINGVAHCEIIFDNNGQPIDFRYLYTNNAFREMMKLGNVDGKMGTEVISSFQPSSSVLLKIYAEAAKNASSTRFEHRIRSLGLWFDVAVFSDRHSEFTAIFSDITPRKQKERTKKLRLYLLEYSLDHDLEDVAQKALDKIESISGSQIGFFHLMREDDTIILNEWSSQTKSSFCDFPGGTRHYSLEEAGVWAECIHEKKPVIHNDYASLPNRRGLPEGHANVIRELTVPVIRHDKVVAILGVGNKKTNYTQDDLEMVSYLSDVMWEIVSRKMVEKSFLESEKQYSSLFQSMLSGVALHEIICDDGGKPIDYRFLAVNPAFERLTGLKADDVVGKTVLKILPGTERRWIERYGRVALTGNLEHFEEYSGDLGKYFEVWAYSPIPGQFACTFIDITERKHAEEEAVLAYQEKVEAQKQLLHSQKMEAIGQLAGGVAHDFNNMLGIILGSAQLLKIDIAEGSSSHEEIDAIIETSKRSRDLTQKLLRFARRDTLDIKTISLNNVVSDVQSMLSRSISKMINISVNCDMGIPSIEGDSGHIFQALVNICNNAADAMPEGGTLAISTFSRKVSRRESFQMDIDPDFQYCVVNIKDTGHGISKEDLTRIFDPFFTTKDPGKGTGLGLSVTHGIIKSHRGGIKAQSEIGEGTEVSIFFPSSSKEPEASVAKVETEKRSSGGELIMVIDDEERVLKVSEKTLKRLGYRTIACPNGFDAISVYRQSHHDISVVMLDFMMPGINGYDTFVALREINPGIKAIIASGFNEQGSIQELLAIGAKAFIRKPYDMKEISRLLRTTIAG